MAFKQHSLLELCSVIVDNRGKTCPIGDVGRPLIATNCVKNAALYPSYQTERFVSEETYSSWFRAHPEPGDLIFVTKGSPGQVCLTPDPVDFCIAQDMVALRANKSLVYPPFLFALLRSNETQDQIGNMHVGSLIPHFKKGDFDKLFLNVPEEYEQIFIGDFYLLVSEIIHRLNKTNELLESIARAIFKSWFVDFDPVRAKVEGRDPEGMDADTAALFPGDFVDQGDTVIPAGWTEGIFGDVSEVARTGVQKAEMRPDENYVGLEHIPRESWSLSSWGTAEDLQSGKSRFQQGDILFGKLRPYFHKVCIAPVDGVCSTDILVLRPKNPEWMAFALCHVSSKQMIDYATRLSNGAKMPRSSWHDLSVYKVILPPDSLAEAFNRIVEPLVGKIIANVHTAATLTALRDTLLPRLISGKLRVPEAEAMLMEVV